MLIFGGDAVILGNVVLGVVQGIVLLNDLVLTVVSAESAPVIVPGTAP